MYGKALPSLSSSSSAKPKFSLIELKELCRANNLAISGTKRVLQDRLESAGIDIKQDGIPNRKVRLPCPSLLSPQTSFIYFILSLLGWLITPFAVGGGIKFAEALDEFFGRKVSLDSPEYDELEKSVGLGAINPPHTDCDSIAKSPAMAMLRAASSPTQPFVVKNSLVDGFYPEILYCGEGESEMTESLRWPLTSAHEALLYKAAKPFPPTQSQDHSESAQSHRGRHLPASQFRISNAEWTAKFTDSDQSPFLDQVRTIHAKVDKR